MVVYSGDAFPSLICSTIPSTSMIRGHAVHPEVVMVTFWVLLNVPAPGENPMVHPVAMVYVPVVTEELLNPALVQIEPRVVVLLMVIGVV